MFNLQHYNEYLPMGLSTAYLDCKNGFESLGFMGVTKISEFSHECFFLSIEEEPNFYLFHSDFFDIFKSNVIQAFHFILYILDLYHSFYVYKIELDNQCMFTFAVYNGDNKKWRYRLDNIGNYKFVANQNLSLNHQSLSSFICSISKAFTNQALVNFFTNLGDVASKLMYAKNKDCYTTLTNMVKYELEIIKDKSRARADNSK